MEFIKLYDWMADTELTLEERVIFALIHQFSENDGRGFWAGYKIMALRTGIQKLQCKQITEHLVEIGAVTKYNHTEFRKTRLVLTSNPDFVDQYED